jgi:hypothetical protein
LPIQLPIKPPIVKSIIIIPRCNQGPKGSKLIINFAKPVIPQNKAYNMVNPNPIGVIPTKI